MLKDLEKIKKLYGENFAKLCRSLFPTILETEGLLVELMTKNFAPSRCLYDDIVNNGLTEYFTDFIFSLVRKNRVINLNIKETPEELFKKAGYDLIKCETYKDMLAFDKYYDPNEELCSFAYPDRVQNFIVFFAVKKNAEEIMREDFKNPQRQDEYGTSVLSLQFTKGKQNILSIKNRYNHAVENPDATFSNDLENIQKGLTDSFTKYYGINFVTPERKLKIPNYVLAKDGRFYRFNHKIPNPQFDDFTYYCENNIIVENGKPKYYDKNRYEIIDTYILDKSFKSCKKKDFDLKKENAVIKSRDTDGFVSRFENVEKIDIINNKETNERDFKVIKKDGTYFCFSVDACNRMVRYSDKNLEVMGENFLIDNKEIKEINAPNLKTMHNRSLYNNEKLTEFIAPNLLGMEKDCLFYNQTIEYLDIPKLKFMDRRCFCYNRDLRVLNANCLEFMEEYCFSRNIMLYKVYTPELKTLHQSCFRDNEIIESFYAPKLSLMKDFCFYNNKCLTTLNLPNLSVVYNNCFFNNDCLTEINLPKLKTMGMRSFYYIKELNKLQTYLGFCK